MTQFRRWVHAWRIYWHIRLFRRDIWKILTGPGGPDDDYTEVDRP